MDNGRTTITIEGREYSAMLPDFATREDLVIAWHKAAAAEDGAELRRVAGAAIGLCSAVGKRTGATFRGTDLLIYGGHVYGWVREQGASLEATLEMGATLIKLCADSVFPREAEVDARAGFSAARADSSTS